MWGVLLNPSFAFPQLRALSVRVARQVACLDCPKLEILSLRGAPRHCTIKRARVTQPHRIDSVEMHNVADVVVRGAPALAVLDIRNCGLNLAEVRSFTTRLPLLQAVFVDGNHVAEADVDAICAGAAPGLTVGAYTSCLAVAAPAGSLTPPPRTQ